MVGSEQDEAMTALSEALEARERRRAEQARAALGQLRLFDPDLVNLTLYQQLKLADRYGLWIPLD